MLIQANSLYLPLSNKSVHMCMTSPPYWGLRQYDSVPITTWGGDSDCKHQWKNVTGFHHKGNVEQTKSSSQTSVAIAGNVGKGEACITCGGWRGHLGLEPESDCLAWARQEPPCAKCFVCHLRSIFKEVWRVLRDDGSLWLNISDTYCRGPGRDGGNAGNLKPKDLCGIPQRLAMALQSDGWYWRSDIIWNKPNCLPESVLDRPVRSYEHVLLLTKAQKYYYDHVAVREEYKAKSLASYKYAKQGTAPQSRQPGGDVGRKRREEKKYEPNPYGRNRRDVWAINNVPNRLAHYAAFPPSLVEVCILAGTSEHGVCSECGMPYKRVIERVRAEVDLKEYNSKYCQQDESFSHRRFVGNMKKGRDAGYGHDNPFPAPRTVGWKAGCKCEATKSAPVVFDPFAGSGTTGEVCRGLNRKFIGIDLSYKYLAEMAMIRTGERPVMERVLQLPLFPQQP